MKWMPMVGAGSPMPKWAGLKLSKAILEFRASGTAIPWAWLNSWDYYRGYYRGYYWGYYRGYYMGYYRGYYRGIIGVIIGVIIWVIIGVIIGANIAVIRVHSIILYLYLSYYLILYV